MRKLINGTLWILLVLQLAVPAISFSQNFQKLHDYDSTYDWGWDIFLQPDGNFLVKGIILNTDGAQSLFNMQLSADANTVLNRRVLRFDSATLGFGHSGEERRLPDGAYVGPINIQWPNTTTGYLYSAAGILKTDALGDTIFIKTYTDTSFDFDIFYCCAVAPDKGIILGGTHAKNTPSNYPGHVIRTDSTGNLLWAHTYQASPSQPCKVLNVVPLEDGRIAVGAITTYWKDAGGLHHTPYRHLSQWFLLLDSSGNVIRDTLYGSKFVSVGDVGMLYKDVSGGYIVTGLIDSLVTEYPDDIRSFPPYIAHVDTNFRMTWITRIPFDSVDGRGLTVLVRQLHDSGYLLVGDAQAHHEPGNFGFAAKVNKHGKLVWRHNYYSDTLNWAYLRDAVEKPDGSIILVGKTFNDTLPDWRANGDIWLLGVDSNGCEIPGCSIIITNVQSSPASTDGYLSIYPNPNSGSFVVKLAAFTNEPVQIIVTDITGRKIKELSATTNEEKAFTLNVPPGMYMVAASTANSRFFQKLVVK